MRNLPSDFWVDISSELIFLRYQWRKKRIIDTRLFKINSTTRKRWRSGVSSGRAVGYQARCPGFESQSGPHKVIIASPCPTSTKWVSRSLNTRRKKRRLLSNKGDKQDRAVLVNDPPAHKVNQSWRQSFRNTLEGETEAKAYVGEK
ncbi:hypothetical protein PoB_000945900 [Plakobranchus ocellatus]|uniref:Uncharacterized protein n=1 Tax=Plakobranchus ocellatus TaxID=259542 RepID=A0AAV3YLE6_9GAST|nr:hypothetical protein PoB_000945900 [Plakobranchus ocellatus]